MAVSPAHKASSVMIFGTMRLNDRLSKRRRAPAPPRAECASDAAFAAAKAAAEEAMNAVRAAEAEARIAASSRTTATRSAAR